MDAGTTTVSWFLKEGAVYGVAVVFLVCVLCLLMYVAITVVRLAKHWIPLWFTKSIESHERVCRTMDDVSESLRCVHDQTHATKEGTHTAIRAMNSFVGDKGNQQRLGIKSDVVFQLKAAERAMRIHARNHHADDDTVEPPPESSPDGT